MSQVDTAHAWWSRLRHQGMLLSPVVQVERYPSLPPAARFPLLDKLRNEYNRFVSYLADLKENADRDEATILKWVDALLEKYVECGHGQIAKQHDIRINVTAPVRIGSRTETLRPHRVVLADETGTKIALLVMADISPHVGRGRGRTAYARFLELLRSTGHRLGLLTNGSQFRLIYAGLDFEAWAEWESERWFDGGEGTEELNGLRQLLALESVKPVKSGASGLLDAIEESRKRQADLSSVLRENVRQAVELILEDVSTAHRTKPDLFASLVASGSERPLTDAEAHEALLQATVRIVMRLVVCLFAESRQLLPVNDPVYAQAYGVRTLYELLDDATRYEGGTHVLFNRQTAWPRLMALCRLIHGGSAHGAFAMRAYGGVLFRPGDAKSPDPVVRALNILEHSVSVGDATVYYVLRRMLRGLLPVVKGHQKTFVEGPVDYTDLRTEFIGLIYEGLLDYRLKRTDEKTGPQVFLNLGREPVLPLARLRDMLENDRKGLKDLLTTLKKEKVTASLASEEEEAEEEEDEEQGEAEEETTEEVVVELEAAVEAIQRPGDYLDAIEAAKSWAREAVVLAGLMGKQGKRETDSEYQARIETEATRLINRVVAPGEFYLVRAGNTRKGTGTFYTRPQLAVPTVHRTLEPLCYDKSEDGTLIPKTPEQILGLKVCDPACGSASFPVAALHYLTEALYKSLCHHRKLDDPAKAARLTLPYGRPKNGNDDELLPFPPDDPERGELFPERVKARLRRHVVERCIYGVDINPLAVELARVSLWVETLDPELPFSFLDHKIKVGNSLVGCWLDRVEDYPLKAWEREGGDGKDGPRTQRIEEFLKGEKIGKRRTGDGRIKREMREVIESRFSKQPALFPEVKITANQVLAEARSEYENLHSLPIADPDERERFYREHVLASPALRRLKQAMDEWCAVWFWPADEESLRCVPTPLAFHHPCEETAAIIERLTRNLRFFHWELEFPDVFTPQRTGFDVILGNPPWDILKPHSREFFTEYDPLYRLYDKQEALQRQTELFSAVPLLNDLWHNYTGQFRALSNWVKRAAEPFELSLARGKTGQDLAATWDRHRKLFAGYLPAMHPYRYTGSADVNSYKMFLEVSLHLAAPHGRIGMVLPSSVHTDSGSQKLRERTLSRYDCLIKLDNENGFFNGLEHNSKFVVLIIGDSTGRDAFHAAFFKHAPLDAVESPRDRLLELSHNLVRLVSPMSLSVPEVYSRSGIDVLRHVYEASQIIPAELSAFTTEFHITNDSRYFKASGELPLYQGAMIWQFDHRYNFFVREQRKWHRAKLESVDFRDLYPLCPKSWVSLSSYKQKFVDRIRNGLPEYCYYRLGCRRQSSLSNQRTFIATILPSFCTASDSLNLLWVENPLELLFLCGLFNSFVYDFVVRTKVTSNVSKFYLQQLPYPKHIADGVRDRICTLVLKLCSTTEHFSDLWESVSGELGITERWQKCESYTTLLSRKVAMAEIDALVASLFSLSAPQFQCIVGTFPIVDRRLPLESRHTTLARRFFDELRERGVDECLRSGFTVTAMPDLLPAEFSNPWTPENGWADASSVTGALMTQSEWETRFGKPERPESGDGGDDQTFRLKSQLDSLPQRTLFE